MFTKCNMYFNKIILHILSIVCVIVCLTLNGVILMIKIATFDGQLDHVADIFMFRCICRVLIYI